MLYINSKRETEAIEAMNDYHLRAAHDKAHRTSLSYCQGDSPDLGRYARIVALNLGKEIERRKNLPLVDKFNARFGHEQPSSDEVREWLKEQQGNA